MKFCAAQISLLHLSEDRSLFLSLAFNKQRYRRRPSSCLFFVSWNTLVSHDSETVCGSREAGWPRLTLAGWCCCCLTEYPRGVIFTGGSNARPCCLHFYCHTVLQCAELLPQKKIKKIKMGRDSSPIYHCVGPLSGFIVSKKKFGNLVKHGRNVFVQSLRLYV